MATYPGLPGPVISDHLSREASRAHYAEGTTFHIGRIEMVGNTGTYIDAPFHRYADGKDLAELALEQVADLDGRVFHADPSRRAIGPELFAGADVRDKAVLVHTGWSSRWETEAYFHGHPFLTAGAAAWLEQAGAALVGIDSLNIDDTSTGERPVHSTLCAPASSSWSTCAASMNCPTPASGSMRSPSRCGASAPSRCGPMPSPGHDGGGQDPRDVSR